MELTLCVLCKYWWWVELSPEPVKGTLLGERVFADVAEDLDMRSPWVKEDRKYNDR